MTKYTVTLPVGNIRLDDVDTLNEQGYVKSINFATRTLTWEVEAETPFDLGVILSDVFDEWIANNLIPYGDVHPGSVKIEPDPRA